MYSSLYNVHCILYMYTVKQVIRGGGGDSIVGPTYTDGEVL